MTNEALAKARRQMMLCVPRGNADARRMTPVSFSVIEIAADGLVFRLVDAQGNLLDLALNPIVAAAFRDCIALADSLGDGQAE